MEHMMNEAAHFLQSGWSVHQANYGFEDPTTHKTTYTQIQKHVPHI